MNSSLPQTLPQVLNPAVAIRTTGAEADAAQAEGHVHPHADEHAPRTFYDRFGAFLGLLCAIHCLVVPLLLGVLPAVGLGFIAEHEFDLTIIGIAFVFAGLAARSGYRAHGDRRVVIGFVAAVSLLAFGHLLGEDGLAGRIPSIIGGFSLAALHIVNLRKTRASCAC